MGLPFVEMGKRAGWVDEGQRERCFYIKFEVFLRQSSGDVNSAAVCMSLEFRAEIWADLGVIEALIILKDTTRDE